MGLYQLFHTRTPAYAAIDETVQAARSLGKPWAQGLVNGVLRNAQRKSEQLHQLEKSNQHCATAHPDWMVEVLKKSWPEYWQAIIAANNQQPPMTLRVNRNRISRDLYLQKLANVGIEANKSSLAPQALILSKPVSIQQLPFFSDGFFSGFKMI